MCLLRKLISSSVIRFIIVGCFNTFLGLTLVFIFYQLFQLGYWLSTALATCIGSINNFFLSRTIVFPNNLNKWSTFAKFICVQAFCYLFAYRIAQPLVGFILQWKLFSFIGSYQEQCAILIGMFIYVILNYILQRFFVFAVNNKFDNVENN